MPVPQACPIDLIKYNDFLCLCYYLEINYFCLALSTYCRVCLYAKKAQGGKISRACSNIKSKSSNNTYLNIVKILSPCERSE